MYYIIYYVHHIHKVNIYVVVVLLVGCSMYVVLEVKGCDRQKPATNGNKILDIAYAGITFLPRTSKSYVHT